MAVISVLSAPIGEFVPIAIMLVVEGVGISVSVEMIVCKEDSVCIDIVPVNVVSTVVSVPGGVSEVCITVDVRVRSLVCVEYVDGRNVLVNVSLVKRTIDDTEGEDESIPVTVVVGVRSVISVDGYKLCRVGRTCIGHG